jgi:hypothetical protein
MTGRELILYILENNLENEQVFQDGHIVGFMTTLEAAVKFEVGVATINAWVERGFLDAVRIGKETYIPTYATLKIKINAMRREE